MKKSVFKGNADFIFGIVVIILAVSGYLIANNTIRDASSAVMPKLILGFIAVMGLGISVSSIVQRLRDKEDDVKISWAEILGGILLPGTYLLVAYILINYLGFYVAEFLLIISLMYLQEKTANGKVTFNLKTLGIVLLFALGAVIVMYLIFHNIFALPTPKGIFGF